MTNRNSIPMYAADYVDQICPVLERYLEEHSTSKDKRIRKIAAAANAAAIATVAKLLMKQRSPSDEMREGIEYLADEIVLAKTGVKSRHEQSTAREGRHRMNTNWATSRWTGPPLPPGSPLPIDCTPAELMDAMEPIIDLLLGLMVEFLDKIKRMDDKKGRGLAIIPAFVSVAKLTLAMAPDKLAVFVETIAEHRSAGMATSWEQKYSSMM